MNRRFDQTAVKPVQPLKATELPPGMHIERKTPVHPPTVGGQVWVPFLRAVFTGLWVMLGGIVITLALHWPAWVPLVFFVAAGSCVWCWHGLSDRLLFLVETATGRDINQDGEVGRPRIDITVEEPFTNNQRRLPDLPCTPDQLQAFAVGVTYEGKTLAIPQWTGRGKPFTRAEYENWLAELHTRGIIVWKDEGNTNQGREFTVYGRSVFRQVADQLRVGVHGHAGGASQALPGPGVGG